MVEILQEYSAKYPQDQLLISHAFNMFIGIVNIPKHQADVKDFIPLSAGERAIDYRNVKSCQNLIVFIFISGSSHPQQLHVPGT